jgi:predicted P-loop ATPase
MQTGEFLFGVTPELVVQAVQLVAREIEIDPLREHLCALGWDGRARLDTWLVKYLGVEDTAYAREVGSKFLIGAAARALVPGAKVDSMLVLMGRQGAGKSTVARILARDFFTDELQDLSRPADAAMQLMGRWVVEVAELDALSRAEVSKVKAFLTRSTDRYRKPYGRHVEEHPRRCVFVGTANVDDWQRDETGGRRFWPIKVGPINADGLRADRDQILAEAVARYRDGEPWWLTDIAAIERATEAQATVYSADAWEVPIATWLDTPTVKLRGWVSVPLALEALGLDKGRWGQSEQNRIVRCLRSLRWERKQVRNEAGKREYRYFPSVTTSCTTGDATGDTGRQGKSASVTTVTTVTSSLSRAATAVGGVKGARVVTGAGGDTGDEDDERKAIRENGGG